MCFHHQHFLSIVTALKRIVSTYLARGKTLRSHILLTYLCRNQKLGLGESYRIISQYNHSSNEFVPSYLHLVQEMFLVI